MWTGPVGVNGTRTCEQDLQLSTVHPSVNGIWPPTVNGLSTCDEQDLQLPTVHPRMNGTCTYEQDFQLLMVHPRLIGAYKCGQHLLLWKCPSRVNGTYAKTGPLCSCERDHTNCIQHHILCYSTYHSRAHGYFAIPHTTPEHMTYHIIYHAMLQHITCINKIFEKGLHPGQWS